MNRQQEFETALPSRLIELALEDLSFIETNEKYIINMDHWHVPLNNGQNCSVCLAGCVMARTFGVSEKVQLIPGEFKTEVEDRLAALDLFRRGWINDGLMEMSIMQGEYIADRRHPVPAYGADPAGFRAAMNEIIVTLKEHGL